MEGDRGVRWGGSEVATAVALGMTLRRGYYLGVFIWEES